jgi:DNA invertase Pin-like site-specific DNA recombinase
VSTIAAYIRVSSRGQSLDSQQSAITQAATARGDRIAKWYSEKLGASTICRPALDELRSDVRAGAVRKLYCFRIDRLTRSGIRDTLGLVEELRAHGCQLATVADGFSLEGPGSEIVLAVLAWAAQMERAALGERIAAARFRIEAAGGRWGRPRRIDPATLQTARHMHAKQGLTLREIAARLKIPRSTLSDALSGKGHYATLSSGAKK